MILGIPTILIISVAVYMIVTTLTTELLKKYLAIYPLLINWVVGLICYVILFFVFSLEEAGVLGFLVFVIVTGAWNGAYKIPFIKGIVRRIARVKE